MELEQKTFYIKENLSINTTVDVLMPGIVPRYTDMKIIGDGFNRYFNLSKVNGKIILIKEIDLEDPDLCNHNQHCCDQNSGCKFDILLRFYELSTMSMMTYKMNIFIEDVNDWSPKFKQEQYIVEFREGMKSIGEKHILPIATDQDFSKKNRIVKYRIQTAEENKIFFQLLTNGDSQAPVLLLLNALNCELKNHFLIDLIATDVENKEGRLLLYIKVIDVNEYSPDFSRDIQTTISILESIEIKSIIIRINATDNDAYPNNKVTFSLETMNEVTSKTFSIDSNNGDIYVINGLDYEKVKRYSLIIIATDNAPNSEKRSSSISINISILDVNDNHPNMKFESENKKALIKENQPIGTPITILKINDRDLNQNGEVTCKLNKNENNFFLHKIVEKFYQIESNKIFDREEIDKYLVKIICSDHGSPSLTTSSTLTVIIDDENDQSPQFVKGNFHFKVKENAVARSYLKNIKNKVAKLKVVDLDIAGNLTFTIDRMEIMNNNSLAIDVDRYSGVLYSVQSLDREAISELRLKVCCNDSIHVTCSDVYISIEDDNDNSPYLLNDVFRLNIEENVIVYDKPLLTFYPRDLDSTNMGFKYSFDQSTVGDVYKYFQLENDKLLLKKPLDREEISTIQFIIQIADNHPRTDRKLFTTAKVFVTVLDQNDNIPKFLFPNLTHYTINLSCHEPIGHMVTKVTATDPDNAENGTVIYELANILPKKETNLFHVDRHTGEIFINSPSLSDQFCRFNFILMISAKDLGDQYLKNENYRKFFARTYGKLQITLLDIPRSYSARITHITPRLILTVILSCSTLFLICLLVAWAFIIFCQRNRNLQAKEEENKCYYSMNLLNNNMGSDLKTEQDDECRSDTITYIHRDDIAKFDSFSEHNSSFRPISYCPITPTIFINPDTASSSGTLQQDKLFHNSVKSIRSHSKSNTPSPTGATSTFEGVTTTLPIKRRANSSTGDYEPVYIIRGHTFSTSKRPEKAPETIYTTLMPHSSVVKFSPAFSNRNDMENYSDTYV